MYTLCKVTAWVSVWVDECMRGCVYEYMRGWLDNGSVAGLQLV